MRNYRRRTYSPDDYPKLADKIVDMMYNGAGPMEVCREIGVSRETFQKYIDEPEGAELLKAFETGLDFSFGFWEKLGRENVDNKDFNAALYFMNMRNRFGWTNNEALITQRHDVALKVELVRFSDQQNVINGEDNTIALSLDSSRLPAPSLEFP